MSWGASSQPTASCAKLAILMEAGSELPLRHTVIGRVPASRQAAVSRWAMWLTVAALIAFLPLRAGRAPPR